MQNLKCHTRGSAKQNRELLGKLIGKDVVEAILTLPKFNWSFRHGGKALPVEIDQVIFVDYEKRKPREEEDLYQHVKTSSLTRETLSAHGLMDSTDGKCIGLISKVVLGSPFTYENNYIGSVFAHIPMLDFDQDERLSPGKRLELIKEGIRNKLMLTGLLLRSSSKNNYHFIGIGDLLDDTDFVTFCGLSLGMKYKTACGDNINLVDSRHVGHSLSPMKYMGELNGWSQYDFIDRFATLRLTPKREGGPLPIVVDIIE